MAYECRILADSIASGVRLTTHLVTFPRFILAEVNTHRVFSRNSASSRAIPVEKRIEQILADPFVPEAFGANKKGMQAGRSLDEIEQEDARHLWKMAMFDAIEAARALATKGVHKQWANRLLEPFAWHTAIITATEWENFFALRCGPDASPEFRKIAEMMRDAMALSKPVEMRVGDWHLPMVNSHDACEQAYANLQQPIDEADIGLDTDVLIKLSVARCARVSYLTHEGRRDVDADLALYDRLLKAGHMSPFEHAATVYDKHYHKGDFGNFRAPWLQHRKMLPNEAVFRDE